MVLGSGLFGRMARVIGKSNPIETIEIGINKFDIGIIDLRNTARSICPKKNESELLVNYFSDTSKFNDLVKENNSKESVNKDPKITLLSEILSRKEIKDFIKDIKSYENQLDKTVPDTSEGAEAYLKYLFDPKSNFTILTIKDGDKFVGGVSVRLFKEVAFEEVLWVSPDKQNKGYGSQLIQNLDTLARDKGVKIILTELDDPHCWKESEIKELGGKKDIDKNFAGTILHGRLGYMWVDTAYFQPKWSTESSYRNNYFGLAARVIDEDMIAAMAIPTKLLNQAMHKWCSTFPPYQSDQENPLSIIKDPGIRWMKKLTKNQDEISLKPIIDAQGEISQREIAKSIKTGRELGYTTQQIGAFALRERNAA